MRPYYQKMQKIKNIAIIAHVDHGKTTLVDKIMFHCQLFRENENKGDLILDNNDLERERGITIVSKNVSVIYKDTKINIIDTNKKINPVMLKNCLNLIDKDFRRIASIINITKCPPSKIGIGSRFNIPKLTLIIDITKI